MSYFKSWLYQKYNAHLLDKMNSKYKRESLVYQFFLLLTLKSKELIF